ncbi:MAG TPA: glutamate-cysteine ligase family protein [Candidatus Dormibacteraeota bacterium]|nr:glutamate-cysteine ligase family protein [Candidatus Dormibacteraeota bacterium]
MQALFLPAGGPGRGPGRVGVEIELLPVRMEAGRPVPATIAEMRRALAHDPRLTRAARITFEPGGQVEMSPAPAVTAAAALDTATELTRRLRRCAAREGIQLISAAVSPWHDPETIGLQNTGPRYRAMQDHFDSVGPWGRRMMRQTAATQVCLDLDPGCESWRLLNRAGPALTAAFAASPLLDGKPSGLHSTRTAIWQGADPDRTGYDGRHLTGVPATGYVELARGAHAIPLARDGDEPLPRRTPMGRWLATGGARPDDDDLDHHLSTLFPPVRPRGYLEVRYLDALPARWLPVPVCVLATLTGEKGARRRALEVLESEPTSDDWWRAAWQSTGDATLRRTALALFDAALRGMSSLDRGYLPDSAPALVAEYRERFVAAGRCPADELLAEHAARPEEPSTWM